MSIRPGEPRADPVPILEAVGLVLATDGIAMPGSIPPPRSLVSYQNRENVLAMGGEKEISF